MHDVEIPLLEHLAIVAVDARPLLRGLARGDEVGGVGHHLLVDVAERHDFDRRDLHEPQQVGLAVPAGADEADPLLRAAELLGVSGEPGDRERGGTFLEEVATIHGASGRNADQRSGLGVRGSGFGVRGSGSVREARTRDVKLPEAARELTRAAPSGRPSLERSRAPSPEPRARATTHAAACAAAGRRRATLTTPPTRRARARRWSGRGVQSASSPSAASSE